MNTILILLLIVKIIILICLIIITNKKRTPINITLTIMLICSILIMALSISKHTRKSSPAFIDKSSISKENLIREINDSIINHSKFQKQDYHLNNLENIRNLVVNNNNPDSLLTYQNVFRTLAHENYITLKTLNKK